MDGREWVNATMTANRFTYNQFEYFANAIIWILSINYCYYNCIARVLHIFGMLTFFRSSAEYKRWLAWTDKEIKKCKQKVCSGVILHRWRWLWMLTITDAIVSEHKKYHSHKKSKIRNNNNFLFVDIYWINKKMWNNKNQKKKKLLKGPEIFGIVNERKLAATI